MNKQSEYEFQEKPWYTAYDFEALRDKMFIPKNNRLELW